MFGIEHWGVKPEIMTMAKGIGNGCPLGAVVTTPKIAATLAARTHFNTFGGNPVVCAQGKAVLEIIEREQLQALLLHLIEQQPALADVVEVQVHRVRLQPAGDTSAPQQRRTPVDPNVFRRQVRTILRSLDRMRSSEAYWHVGAVVNEVRQVLEPV